MSCTSIGHCQLGCPFSQIRPGEARGWAGYGGPPGGLRTLKKSRSHWNSLPPVRSLPPLSPPRCCLTPRENKTIYHSLKGDSGRQSQQCHGCRPGLAWNLRAALGPNPPWLSAPPTPPSSPCTFSWALRVLSGLCSGSRQRPHCVIFWSSGAHVLGWPPDGRLPPLPSPLQPAPCRSAWRRAPFPTRRSPLHLCTWASWVYSAGPQSWPVCTARASSMLGRPATMIRTPGSRYGKNGSGAGGVVGGDKVRGVCLHLGGHNQGPGSKVVGSHR